MRKARPWEPAVRERMLEAFRLDHSSPSGIAWAIPVIGGGGKKEVGDPAGCLNKSIGYWQVGLNGKRYYVHRIIWFFQYGEDPGAQEIDHIDGKRSNNDPANLRLASHRENLSNLKKSHANTSGHKGVSRKRPWGGRSNEAWVARIKHRGGTVRRTFSDSKHGGTEAALAAAVEWVRATREKLHGEFARHG